MAQFRSALTTTDFMAGTVACTAGLFTRLGARTVQAGELLSLRIWTTTRTAGCTR
jgi:hypothetical protein